VNAKKKKKTDMHARSFCGPAREFI